MARFAFTDLTAERAVCAEQQLLTGLTLCIEGTTNLRATEGTVVEQTAVFTSERNTLSHTLIDDVVTYLQAERQQYLLSRCRLVRRYFHVRRERVRLLLVVYVL